MGAGIHVSSIYKDEHQQGKAGFVFAIPDSQFSLRLGYACFDILDLGSTETRGSALVFGTRDTLGSHGTLEISDGCGSGQCPLTGFGSHGAVCMKGSR